MCCKNSEKKCIHVQKYKKKGLKKVFFIISYNITFISISFLLLLQQKLDKASLEQNWRLPTYARYYKQKQQNNYEKVFHAYCISRYGYRPKVSIRSRGHYPDHVLELFNQFQAGNEDVSFTTPANYGDFYIVGHSATTAATTVAKSLKNVTLGNQTYQINNGIKLPGANTTTIATKASEITKKAIT